MFSPAYPYPAYPHWAQNPSYSNPAATTSSQEASSTTPPALPKRERVRAVIKNPDTKEELDLEAIAAEKAKKVESSSAKAASTQSTALKEAKDNPINSANTITATKSVTTSSSDRAAVSPNPSVVTDELLRYVSEDTNSDNRQAAATTVRTTTTSTKADITSSTVRPATTIKPNAIKPVDKVETKVNNINGNHESVDDINKSKNEAAKNVEIIKEEIPLEGGEPVEASVEVSIEATSETTKEAPIEALAEEADKSTEVKEENGEKDTLNYEPWQYNPMSNRTGKKKYDKQFLMDVCEKICKLSIFLDDKPDHSMDNYSFEHQVDMFAPAFSRNIAHLPNNRQNDASRRPNQQNYMGRSSAGQERPRKIIAPSSSLTQEVELKTVANPWRPGKDVKEEVPPDVVDVEDLKKKFRSILNKLTPNNFENLAQAVTSLNIDTETKLGEVIDIVFAKALAEPGYCVLYGQMCSHLKKITAGTTQFGATLLNRCQNQFQSDIYSGLNIDERKQKIEEETDAEVKKHMNEELYEEMYRCRMRGLGLIKFIGELYKIEMLNDMIMFDCIVRLLHDTSEESLECLCDLLVTIGEKLDKSSQKSVKEEKTQKGPAKTNANQNRSLASIVASNASQQQQSSVPEAITTLDDIFDRLHKIRKNKDLPISVRIRFKLLDVCELREKDNWQSKRTKDNNPKKIDEIRDEHREDLENERNRVQQSSSTRRGQENRNRSLGHSGGSSSRISSMAHESSGNRGGVSNMHGSASSHAIRDHSLDDRSKNNSDSFESSKQHQQVAKSVLGFLNQNPASKQSEDKSLRPAAALKPWQPKPKAQLNKE